MGTGYSLDCTHNQCFEHIEIISIFQFSSEKKKKKKKKKSIFFVMRGLHQENIHVKCLPSYTLLLYRETEVYSGIPF